MNNSCSAISPLNEMINQLQNNLIRELIEIPLLNIFKIRLDTAGVMYLYMCNKKIIQGNHCGTAGDMNNSV